MGIFDDENEGSVSVVTAYSISLSVLRSNFPVLGTFALQWDMICGQISYRFLLLCMVISLLSMLITRNYHEIVSDC